MLFAMLDGIVVLSLTIKYTVLYFSLFVRFSKTLARFIVHLYKVKIKFFKLSEPAPLKSGAVPVEFNLHKNIDQYKLTFSQATWCEHRLFCLFSVFNGRPDLAHHIDGGCKGNVASHHTNTHNTNHYTAILCTDLYKAQFHITIGLHTIVYST